MVVRRCGGRLVDGASGRFDNAQSNCRAVSVKSHGVDFAHASAIFLGGRTGFLAQNVLHPFQVILRESDLHSLAFRRMHLKHVCHRRIYIY